MWRLLVAFGIGLAGCTGSGDGEPLPPEPAADGATTPIPLAKYAWDPAAGDASVPAKLGGPGFDGAGWQTRMEVHQLGDPNAIVGGSITVSMPDWPLTLRLAGANWNSYFNYTVAPLLYDTLVDLDPVTLEFVPRLATHWWISDDRYTYRFRINPAARWSDGREVTAEDVVASFALQTDPTLLDPSTAATFGKMQATAVSKYIVEVKVLEESWRNFLYFGTSLWVFPSAEIGKLKGSDYLDRYQFAYTAVSGPYQVLPADIQTGTSITLTRRADWWGDSNPVWDGWYNFEKMKFLVVNDATLRFEKLKKGEIDFMVVPKAQWWVEDIPALPSVKHGLLVPRKFYNDAPLGFSGMAINQRREPLDELNLRKALQLLYDRKTMIEQLFYGEYEPLSTYFPGGPYANLDNPVIDYDEAGAVALIEQSGWKELNGDGYRVKDGKELALTVTYDDPILERSLTVFQESCKKAGIKLDLQLLDPSTAWTNLQEKDYQLQTISWGGLVFPNPESMWRSRFAFEPDNNNVTAFVNGRADYLMDKYEREYDLTKRIAIVRELDAMIYADHPYVLDWVNPAQRVLYWNRFGMPPWGTVRTGTFATGTSLFVLWWEDPARIARIEEAKTDATVYMAVGPRELKFWKQWGAAHPETPAQ